MTKEKFLLLPGWTRSQRTYKKFFAKAPKDIDIEFVNYNDLISDKEIKSFPEKLLVFIKEKKINQISLIGFSLGGAFAFEFALKYPEVIKKLYIVNAAGIYGKESIWEIFINQTKNLLERKGAKMIRSIRNSNALSTNPLLNIKLGLHANKIDFKNRQIPEDFPETVIFWGEKDVVHHLWQGEKFHELITGSKLVVIKNGGHDWLVYEPEKFWQQVD